MTGSSGSPSSSGWDVTAGLAGFTGNKMLIQYVCLLNNLGKNITVHDDREQEHSSYTLQCVDHERPCAVFVHLFLSLFFARRNERLVHSFLPINQTKIFRATHFFPALGNGYMFSHAFNRSVLNLKSDWFITLLLDNTITSTNSG